MQVILREDVEKVGLRGEVVDVAAGFARNYLLPRRLAEPAAAGRVAELEKLATSRARHEAQSFEQAQELVQKLEGAELRFDVQAGETGTLFGSVTATDIADRVWETQRIRIDRRKLDLPESIKRIGRYEVPVELFQDVTATIRLAVVPEGGELPPEEELEALDQAAAAEATAAAAEAEEARAAAEAATEAAVAEVEAEEQPSDEPAASEDQGEPAAETEPPAE
jgi:large subunit ribosomal protein L9